ncbi:DUF4174 domain-containing protein [Fretibacter rubidus]|uniref:DUF4174 domain-containing protein n=1 Tax=Fretibacter rubidus TaxID=570162 RepID=UPI00352AAD70
MLNVLLRKFRIAAIIGAAVSVIAQPLIASAGTNSPLGHSRILASCAAKPLDAIAPTMNWPGFQERDLVLVVFRDQKAYIQNKNDGLELISDPTMLRYGKALTCERFDEFMLIGKDRGPKRRWLNTVPIQELFQTIDAMPMRQYEMRKTQSRRLKPEKE